MAGLQWKGRHDGVDRVNYRLTSGLLLIAAGLIVGNLSWCKPIKCSPLVEDPSRCSDEYAEGYCPRGNMYQASLGEDFPLDEETRAQRSIFNYQWVPFILIAQALFFITPMLMYRAGYWIESLLLPARAVCCSERSAQRLDPVSILIEAALEKWARKKSSGSIFVWTGFTQGYKRTYRLLSSDAIAGARVAAARKLDTLPTPTESPTPYSSNGSPRCSYLVFKVLQLANAHFQLYVVGALLGRGPLWAFEALKDVITGNVQHHSENFPHMAYCDVNRPRPPGGYRQYIFQCVLTVNWLIELCLLVIWCWLFVLCTINVLNLLKWAYFAVSKRSARVFIAGQLANSKHDIGQNRLKIFVNDYLGLDGVTALRLIESNFGGYVTSHIVAELWTSFENPDGEVDAEAYKEGVLRSEYGGKKCMYGSKQNKYGGKSTKCIANGATVGDAQPAV